MSKRWQLFSGMLVLAAGIVLILSLLYQWTPWTIMKTMQTNWGFQTASPHGMSQPPVFLSILAALFAICCTGIVIIYILPNPIQKMTSTFRTTFRELLWIFLTGVLSGLLILLISISSALNLWTLPLTLLFLSILSLSSLYGTTALSIAFGHFLLIRIGIKDVSPVREFLLGIFILYPWVNLPWFGPIYTLLITCLGLGVVITTRYGSGRTWNLESYYKEGEE